MRSFFWKFVLCLLPCALAAWVTADAVVKYTRGEAGGFKFGADLVGGTVLVYEIDLSKTAKADKESNFDPVRNIGDLAEALKRRIDPNDLYNIVIRPAGGEGRVEIVLPTGGVHRAVRAEERWRELVTTVSGKYGLTDVEVGRGKVLELADRIQHAQAETIWSKKLFADSAAWKRLTDSALEYWAVLDKPGTREKVAAVPAGDLNGFATKVQGLLNNTTDATSEKTIQTWVKKQAWEEVMHKARQKWAFLAPYEEDMRRIPPDNIGQLVTFVESKGSIIGQAALSLLQPLLGDNVYDSVPRKEVEEFVRANYGPSANEILEEIRTHTEDTGYSRDLTVEEVQRIKDLVAKVGSLEFRILANSGADGRSGDDVDAVNDAIRQIEAASSGADARLAKELKEAAEKGLSPPGPRDHDGAPKKYTLNLARNSKSLVTYSWVELGPQERKALDLDNAAKNDPSRNRAWLEASLHRNQALRLPGRAGGLVGDRFLLQGALFFSRKCEDRNLPEEERRQKEVEYFVLARDPEFEPGSETVRTPRIDGSYLVRAEVNRQDITPAVSFTFNERGGELFGNLTRKNVSEGAGPEAVQKRRHLAIVLDGLVMSAPTINSEIRTHGQITGSFTQKEVESLVNILRAGRLPATLKPQPVSESTIGATLGTETINAGVTAVMLAFAAVLAFMIVYYRFAGLVASAALLANLLLTVGFMVAVQATFTLPGLAGLVLMLGMAVDANVLIYERLREERERGASLAQALRNGYSHALPTIIDTHLSSIFTGIVLYVVGNDQLKGFAVALIVGLIISLFTSLYMTRVLFDFWLSKGWLTKLSMLRLFARPDIDFMGIRYTMFAVTLVMAVLGLGLFIARLPDDLDIDFVGGTAYGAKLTTGLDGTELRALLSDEKQAERLEGVKVASVPGSEGRRYVLTYPSADSRTVTLVNPPAGENLSDADREKAVQERAAKLPDASVELLYPSTNNAEEAAEIKEGRSRQFVVRTTEREPDLVQAAVDQLLRVDGQPLLRKLAMKAGPLENGNALLTFTDPATGEAASGSPSFVKTLLAREARHALGISDQTPLPFFVDVTGEGKSEADGSYHAMKVSFGEVTEDQAAKARQALQATQAAFADNPQPDRLENFDSQLATETRYRAMAAILMSWGAILLYLWFRFGSWTFGLAAVVCLVHDLALTLGVIAVCHYLVNWMPFLSSWPILLEDFKINLPAVAALLTLVGYSVNDTIVVFDRIREVRGKNPDLTPKMINDSINQTLSRTVLASLTTWLVVAVLYLFGGPGVHLFAFVMVVGVIIGTYSSIYIASPLLLMFRTGRHDEPTRPGEARPQPVGATGESIRGGLPPAGPSTGVRPGEPG